MHVTVGICTWNRADLLDGTLKSLAAVHIPPGVEWKVIVANNNSTDHTEQVLDKHQHRLPLERMFIGRQGKSYALNEVVERLEGDLVLWTDDDVIFDKNWLAAYVEAARRWPHAKFFGGWVIPKFLAPEPHWLRPAWPNISGVFAARELGDEPFEFQGKELPFGANMAARVELVKQYRYDPELGRRGELLLSGEETALMLQWIADGHTGMWVPNSRVEHVITPDRMTAEHVGRFFYSLAESKRPRGWRNAAVVRALKGSFYMMRAIRHTLLGKLQREHINPRRWMKYIVRIHYCWGRVESQWYDLPQAMKPPAIQRMQQQRRQPRYAAPLSEKLLPSEAGRRDAA